MFDDGLNIRRESLTSFRRDIEPLLKMEWEEAPLDDWPFCYEMDWHKYGLLDAHNMLLAYTLRDGHELVGYVIFVKDYSHHHHGYKVAKLDLFFVNPEYRKGRNAIDLLRYAQDDMDEMGVDMTIVSCFMESRVEVLYKRMGYKPLERTFVRFKYGR